MENPSSLHPTFAPPDRKYIQCDNEGCGSVSPQLRCSRCRTVYYCSKPCQINNWPEHRSICRDFNTIKTQSPGSGDSNIAPVDMTKRVDPAAEMSCGICLEDTIEKPHALSKHVFCYPCLQAYQSKCKQANQPLRCPFCRADTEDVQGNIVNLPFCICARLRGNLNQALSAKNSYKSQSPSWNRFQRTTWDFTLT